MVVHERVQMVGFHNDGGILMAAAKSHLHLIGSSKVHRGVSSSSRGDGDNGSSSSLALPLRYTFVWRVPLPLPKLVGADGNSIGYRIFRNLSRHFDTGGHCRLSIRYSVYEEASGTTLLPPVLSDYK